MTWFILISAAFLAGVLNTIAGGGTFLTFPALVYAGIPPVVANATSAIAVFPGYLGGALGFRKEIAAFDRSLLIRLTLVTLAGGLAGSLLLMVSSNRTFSFIVPFLLLAATLVFLFGETIRSWAADRKTAVTAFGAGGLFIVSVYGGYFNGGLGIVLLALFALWGMQDIHEMNGLKNALSFALSAISVAAFTVGGFVEWKEGLVMAASATVGGYAGAPLARAIPKHFLRFIVAAVGFTMTAIFLYRAI